MTKALRPSGLWLSLALMLLVLRALVPAGWMPAQQKGQWITICSGAGVTMAWMGADGKIDKHPAPAKSEKSNHCAFAGLGAAADLSIQLPEILAPVFSTPFIPAAITSVAIGRGLAAPPPPKTGPPSLI